MPGREGARCALPVHAQVDRCAVDETYREALDAFFTAVREAKVARIAVDLRANAGGNSGVVDEFLRYLDVESYASFSGDVRWSAAALQQRKGAGQVRFEPATANRRRNARVETPFAGELFVLTGPGTFSSGNWFATIVQDNRLGKVVGEPTGNAPSSHGDILSFTLPNSGLAYTVSFKRWIRPDPARDPASCIEPDVVSSGFMAGTADQATYLATGIRAVQSTPLVSRAGKLVGMISTHWKQPHEPSERDLLPLGVFTTNCTRPLSICVPMSSGPSPILCTSSAGTA